MARLPIPGKDSGTWGDILNEYLSQSHTADGALKDNVVTDDKITDGTISEAKLATAVQTKLNQASPTWSTLSGKPTVVAAGVDQAAARAAIGA